MTRDSLAIAIEALSWMGFAGMGERSALLKASRELEINNPNDLRQAHKLIMETTRFQNRIEWIISQIMPEDQLHQSPHGIRSLLSILAYTTYVEEQKAEKMVSWARQILGWRDIHPYEECIARLLSGRAQLTYEGLTDLRRLALETCHPEWYVERLIRVFGRSYALRILKRDLQPVPTFARINSLKAGDVAEKLQGFHASKIDGVRDTYRLDGSGQTDRRAKLTNSGEIVIQDLASVVAGLVVSPKPGQTALDVCSAPGNKTTHLAAQMCNEGKIYSIEISRTRLSEWRKETARAGCSIATAIHADARNIPLNNEVDVALVDPPCSNSGVFARNPASKWRITSGHMSELVSRQKLILEEASQRLVAGGTLVYCTCSILPEENEYVIEAFLNRNPDFKLIPHDPFVGSPGLRGLAKCQRFYPHLHECNGYFIAKLQRAD